MIYYYFFHWWDIDKKFTKSYTATGCILPYVKATFEYVLNVISLNSFKLGNVLFPGILYYARIMGMKSRPNKPENKDIHVAMFYLKIFTFYM